MSTDCVVGAKRPRLQPLALGIQPRRKVLYSNPAKYYIYPYERYNDVYRIPGDEYSRIRVLTPLGFMHCLYDEMVHRYKRLVHGHLVAPPIEDWEEEMTLAIEATAIDLRNAEARQASFIADHFAGLGYVIIDMEPQLNDGQISRFVTTLFILLNDDIMNAVRFGNCLDDVPFLSSWRRYVNAARGASYWHTLALLDAIRSV